MTMDILFSLLKCILDFVLFYWFSLQFFESKIKKRKYLPMLLILVLAFIIFQVNQFRIPMLNTLAALICAIIINVSLFEGNIFSRLLCSAAEVVLIVACEFIPISIYSLATQYDIATITQSTINNAGFNLIGTGLFSVAVLVIKSIINFLRVRHKQYTINENFSIVIVPIISIVIIYYILDSNRHLPAADNIIVFEIICIYFGLLLMNITVIISDASLKKRYQLQREIDALYQLEKTNKIVIEQQDQYIGELKGFEHDYKKQMEGIRHLINVGRLNLSDEKNLLTYTDEMFHHIKETYRFSFVRTTALRSILSQAQIHCTHYGILLCLDIQYTDFDFMTFPDIYSVFENPIDNAIMACSAINDPDIERYIAIQIIRKKNLIFIEVKNAKCNEIIHKNGRIQTTKSDAKNHGIGIKNMEQAVKKYNGYTNISYSGHEFVVSITLSVP